MAWPIQKVIAEQAPDMIKNFRVTSRVKTVAPVVNPHARQLETPGVPTNATVSLQ
jgi:hypothetical protein